MQTGDIKISDFGAAITGGAERQVSGIGSPAYMSPQQVKEQPLDHRTDIYSLGVVMYQLLTGLLPFQASNNYNMVHQIINTVPTPVGHLRKDLPPNARCHRQQGDGQGARGSLPVLGGLRPRSGAGLPQPRRSRRRREFADSEKFDTLRALPFFSDFSDVEIWEVVRFSEWKNVDPGAEIMKDGNPGFLLLLAEGELKVTKNGKILNLFDRRRLLRRDGGHRSRQAAAGGRTSSR